MDLNEGYKNYRESKASEKIPLEDQIKMGTINARSSVASTIQGNRKKKSEGNKKQSLIKSTELFDKPLVKSTDLFEENKGKSSANSGVDYNKGMADYIVQKNAKNLSYADWEKMASKIGEKAFNEIVKKEQQKQPTERADERQAASKIFNSGSKKKPAQAQRIQRESAPVIDFEMLASRGYMNPEMREKPGEGLTNPVAPVDNNGELEAQTALNEPKQRLGKDLMYSKARENTGELEAQKPIAEPQKPNYDDMMEALSNADDNTKAKVAEFLASLKQ